MRQLCVGGRRWLAVAELSMVDDSGSGFCGGCG